MTDDENLHSQSQRALLVEEYRLLVPQIVHWDSHMWDKSKFFLTLESASLGAAIYAFRDAVELEGAAAVWLAPFVVMLAGFNIYIGYVWFRTNRRNREYLELRFRRARLLETELGGTLKTFTDDPNNLSKRHSSSRWEIHLPTGFAVAWLVLSIVSLLVNCDFI